MIDDKGKLEFPLVKKELNFFLNSFIGNFIGFVDTHSSHNY